MLQTDTLPAFCQARLLILGVGNVLFGDDGFGPAVIDHLCTQYDIPEDLYVMDVGVGVRKVLFTVTLSELVPDEIVIVDAVDWGLQVGQLKEIAAGALPESKIDDYSLHQVPTSNLLRELQEQREIRVMVLACDVGQIEQVIQSGLSPEVHQAIH
jgi:coenzyme F420 hydrogenase subunit delta